MLDFDQVQQALDRLKAATDVAEAHGTLCGLLTAQQGVEKWLQLTLDALPESGDLLAREHVQLLMRLFEQSQSSLNADDMSFELLLPADEDDFEIRLQGLASWCRGFLYGLALNGKTRLENLSQQGRECMDDLLQISNLDASAEQTADSENDYAEIAEHVRLSVIYINAELHPVLPTLQVQ